MAAPLPPADRPAYTPAQRATLDLLGRQGDPVHFDPAVVAELRADFAAGAAELGRRLADADPAAELRVTKHDVAAVLSCEATWAAPDPFAWTVAMARGTVAHRAIQLALNWKPADPAPADVVDEALERVVVEDRSIGEWLRGVGPADRADLRAVTIERVTAFFATFPPLRPAWRPVTEAMLSHPAAGPIVLRAKVDLALGAPRGDESTKVIIDLKSGRLHPRHRDDLRFYALVETLTFGLPPRLLVSYSLESCAADPEPVTEGLLRSSLRRTLDAVERMVEVRHEGREPTRSPGPGCRWCPQQPDCPPGIAHLASLVGLADPA